MADITGLTLSYPDFVDGATISPDEFDQNNTEIVDKVNELIDRANDVDYYDTRYYTETEADAKYATLEQLVEYVNGGIPDGTIIDDELSNTAGQIKGRVADLQSDYDTLQSDYDAFIATKGVAEGLASLGADGYVTDTELPTYVARGTFTDTTTSIPAASEYTKTIALGFAAESGTLQMFTSGNYNAIILFTKVATDVMGVGCGSSSAFMLKDDPLLCLTATYPYLDHVYIDGTDLKMVFHNTDASNPHTLNITNCVWEVRA